MVKCTFCSKRIEEGTGKMFVSKDGKVVYFCSMKCEKNKNKLKRTARSMKWSRGENK